MELLEKYQQELEIDTAIDEVNLTDTAYKLPALKHKWVARLINAKIELNKLEKQKLLLKEEVVSKLSADNNNRLSKIAISKTLSSTEDFKKLTDRIATKIEEYKMIILYLEKVEHVFKNMTYDLKNIIDLTRLETT